ncbi:hypothetical protein MNBD_GAMMA08-2050 [hydrothermal vent metagenome]|uniref:Uncharacterized protein n=1 Tax=hydrothermal vent metagenome TaxID=652676 RepID=A0A3B0XZN5_9ZZZZ
MRVTHLMQVSIFENYSEYEQGAELKKHEQNSRSRKNTINTY